MTQSTEQSEQAAPADGKEMSKPSMPSSKSDGTLLRGGDVEVDDGALRRMRRNSQNGRLSVRGEYNFGIPTQQGAKDHIEEHHGKESWRMKILEFLHRKRVQFSLMGLLLLDVVILFIELFLLTQYPMCGVIERDCISCCPHEKYNATDGDHRLRFLAGGEDYHDEVCESNLEPNYDTAACDPHKWSKVHHAETVFFSLTIVILSVFFIELNMEMVALHPDIFFRQFFYSLDYFIVLISLVSELSLHFIQRDDYAALVGLLVFVRIWRFVRIGHGIVEVTSELTHRKYERLLDYAGELEAIVKNHNLKRPHCPHSVQKALEEHESVSYHTSGSP